MRSESIISQVSSARPAPVMSIETRENVATLVSMAEVTSSSRFATVLRISS